MLMLSWTEQKKAVQKYKIYISWEHRVGGTGASTLLDIWTPANYTLD